jgi:hypothetical protein
LRSKGAMASCHPLALAPAAGPAAAAAAGPAAAAAAAGPAAAAAAAGPAAFPAANKGGSTQCTRRMQGSSGAAPPSHPACRLGVERARRAGRRQRACCRHGARVGGGARCLPLLFAGVPGQVQLVLAGPRCHVGYREIAGALACSRSDFSAWSMDTSEKGAEKGAEKERRAGVCTCAQP